MNADWLEILSKVRAGEMSVEEAAARLENSEPGARLETGTLEAHPDAGEPVEPLFAHVPYVSEEPDQPVQEDIQPDLGWWRNAWLILFWTGSGVIVLSALFMGWAYTGSRGFWMFCSWLPMLLGMLILALGWWSRQARWFHVRVNEAKGSKVSISAPLPLGLVSWFLRVFGPRIPSLREKHMDDMYMIFDALEEAEGPITVEVDDKDGEKVRVYIL